MDPELKAYFDERFRENAEQISALREENAQRFDQIDRRFDEVDGRFERVDGRFDEVDGRFARVDRRFDEVDGRFARVDRRFDEVDGRFERVDGRFDEVDGRFDEVDGRFERVEETGRQTLVLVESQSGDIRLIAEGHAALNARIDRLTSEVAQIFGQVKAWIEPYLRNLDRRIRILEGEPKRQEGEVL